MKDLFPAFLDLNSRKCLVIGGGPVAERKVRLLLQCQAEIHVVSPDLTSFLVDLVEQGRIIYFSRHFEADDINGKFLVISAAGDKTINDFLNGEYLNKGFLLNIVDEPEKGNFHVPAVLKRGKLRIAVSTSGASPLLARNIRKRLEADFGPEYEHYLDILAQVRTEVSTRILDPERRQRIYQQLVNSDLLELIKNGDEAKVKERVNKCLS